jgi:uncharacterized protein (TIGR00255 family)
MIQSMTGYGQSQALMNGIRLEVELRSVNHKFCEISVRLPKPLSPIENLVKKRLQKRFARGRLDLSVSLNGDGEQARKLEMDLDLARQYRHLLEKLKKRLSIRGEIDLALLTHFRNFITVSERPQATRQEVRTFYRILDQASARLERMRREEGRELAKDLARRIQKIRNAVRLMKAQAPKVVSHYRKQLLGRVRRLTEGVPMDNRRLEQEVALFATKCDISEELTRLESHMAQFEAIMKKGTAIGRSLDFLIQEMHREVNTCGSKANDVFLSQQVILVKTELEKIREQVQNIE